MAFAAVAAPPKSLPPAQTPFRVQLVQPGFDEKDVIPDLDDVPVPVTPPRVSGQTDKERLGQLFFFDVRVSVNNKEACATCHEAAQGFAGPIPGQMPGTIQGRGGKRTAPSVRYIAFSPKGPTLQGGQYVGGDLWDSRAEDITELGAPFDPNELANVSTPDPHLRNGYSKLIAQKIRNGMHRNLFVEIFHSLDSSSDSQVFFEFMDSIKTFLSSTLMNPFSSDYDEFIANGTPLNASAERGRNLFFGSAGCSNCHSSAGLPVLGIPNPSGHDLFSMFCLANTGVGKNPNNPFYRQTDCSSNPGGCNPAGFAFIDFGLGMNAFGSTAVPNATPPIPSVPFFNVVPGDIPEFRGLFKAPILRNRGLAVSFFHNGSETTLEGVIDRDADRNIAVDKHGKRIAFDLRVGPPVGFTPLHTPPEVLDNVVNVAGVAIADGNPDDNATSGELGNIPLSKQDRFDLKSFIIALTDKDLKKFLPKLP